jgi:gamma-glutamylcyclotransferase
VQNQVIYFAYGSNMSTKRLLRRVRSAHVLGIARLDLHRLAFHKVSDKDGSGKCDIVEHESRYVMGVLFRLDAEAKEYLDGHEGLGNGYVEKNVTVIDGRGEAIVAVTYTATMMDSTLKPFTWYLRHVIEGAKEASLPGRYIETLHQIEALADPEQERARRELAIYS